MIDDWLTAVRILSGVCALLIMLAGWLGYDGFQSKQENQATKEQVTTIVNYYYDQGCKPND